MTDHLFVYGSLLSACAHPKGERLRAEARLLAAATLPGRLYRVAWYPGMTESIEPGDIVHGEVYSLGAPASTLAWLDAYEGVVGADASSAAGAGEYERIVRSARLQDGAEVAAWVYVYRRPVSEARRIASGRWSEVARS